MNLKIAAFGLLAIHFSLVSMTPLKSVLVLPVQYHSDAKEWYVLLGQNGDSYFGGFRKKIVNETPNQAATKALTNQTNALYNEKNFSLDTAHLVTTPPDELVFFVKVPYLPEKELMKKGTSTRFKSDFTWVRASDILLSQGDVTPRGKKRAIDRSILAVLRKQLPDALHALLATTNIQQPPQTAVQSSSSTSTAHQARPVGKYRTLAEFVLDDTPHQPTFDESSAITPSFELLVDQNVVPSFWIAYDDLKNADGSVLTAQQKKDIVEYLKHNEHHVDDQGFRLANNNLFVLAQGRDTKFPNIVWKYIHRYMRQLPNLVETLRKKSI